jgi:hypothetical protein
LANPQDNPRRRPRLVNRLFGTQPLLFHAQGYHSFKPVWPKIREFAFNLPPLTLGPRPRVTAITCNNGHQAMGLFEESCARLGLPVQVGGTEHDEWINAVHKPPAILKLLDQIDTEWVLYADSRDVLILDDPELLVDRMAAFDADLLFGACMVSWPNLPEFSNFEASLPGAQDSAYKFINGGMWLGRVATVRALFEDVRDAEILAVAPDSEQGKIRQVLRRHVPQVGLDHRCTLFQNVGFVFEDIFDVLDGKPSDLQQGGQIVS